MVEPRPHLLVLVYWSEAAKWYKAKIACRVGLYTWRLHYEDGEVWEEVYSPTRWVLPDPPK